MGFLVKTGFNLASLPVLTTLVGLMVASVFEKRGKDKLSRWLVSLAFAFAYLAGHRIATGSFPTDLTSPEHWVPILGFIASLLSAADNWWQTHFLVRFLLRTLLGIVAVAVLISPLQTLPALKKATWCILAGAGFALAWSAKDNFAKEQSGAITALSLSLLSAFVSASLFIGRTALVSQLASVIVAICTASFLFGLFRRDLKLSSGAVGVVTVLILSLVANGLFYAELPLLSATLFWLAFLAGWVQFLPIVNAIPQAFRVAVQPVAVVAFSVFGLGFTVYKLGLPTAY